MFKRESSILLSSNSDDTRKRLEFEIKELRENLRHAQHTVAELRLANMEANERTEELAAELYVLQENDLPIGGLSSMLKADFSTIGDVFAASDPPVLQKRNTANLQPRLAKKATTSKFNASFSADNQKFLLMTRWPDLRKKKRGPELEMFYKKVDVKKKDKEEQQPQKVVEIDQALPFLAAVFRNRFIKRYIGNGVGALLFVSFSALFGFILMVRLLLMLIL